MFRNNQSILIERFCQLSYKRKLELIEFAEVMEVSRNIIDILERLLEV